MNTLECNSLGGYSNVTGNLKHNILKELTNSDLNIHAQCVEFNSLLEKIEKLNK